MAKMPAKKKAATKRAKSHEEVIPPPDVMEVPTVPVSPPDPSAPPTLEEVAAQARFQAAEESRPGPASSGDSMAVNLRRG